MAQCYDWNSNTQQVEQLPSDIWIQCPSGNTCCIAGGVCLDYNLCHTPGSTTSDTGSYSSYYVARCSDPTYTSPDCQKVCDAPGPPDAVYNYTSSQWNCCGKDAAGNVSCDDPTNEVFQAPAPANLIQLVSGVAAVSTETLAAGTRTSTASSSPSSISSSNASASSFSSSSVTKGSTTTSSQPTQTNSSLSSATSASQLSSLSTGAKAGIAIGIVLAVLALAALTFFLIRRRRRSPSATHTNLDSNEANMGYGAHQQSLDQKYPNGGLPFAVEKSADSEHMPRSELSSTNELVDGMHVAGGKGGRFHEIGTSN